MHWKFFTPPPPSLRLFLMVHPLGLIIPRDLCFSGHVVRAKILNVLGSRTKERHIALFKIKANAWALPDFLGLFRPSDTSPKCIDRKGLGRRRTGTTHHWLDSTLHHEIKHLRVRREYSTVHILSYPQRPEDNKMAMGCLQAKSPQFL